MMPPSHAAKIPKEYIQQAGFSGDRVNNLLRWKCCQITKIVIICKRQLGNPIYLNRVFADKGSQHSV